MSFPKYPKYKDSGVNWLGEVPEHWDVLMLRRCLLEHRQGYYFADNYVDSGVKLLRITDLLDFGEVDFAECPRVENRQGLEPFLLRESDFVFARTGGAGTFGLIKQLTEPVAYASYLIRFRFEEEAQPGFLRNFFLSASFQNAVKQNIHGGVNQNVHAEDIKNQYIALPPGNEQGLIASFLDRETAKIDSLIAEQQRLIELLKEKRQAVISHAVTKGLNPHAPMKPSGIEWLGDVPEHWAIKRVKHLLEVLTDFTANGSFASLAENVTYLSEGFSRLVRLTDLRESLDNEGIYVDEAAHRFLAKSELFGGEVLIANVGAYAGYACLMPFIGKNATLGPNMYLIRFKVGTISNAYGLLCLMSINVQEQLKLAATSTAQPKLNKDDVKGCSIILPPIEEQTAILTYLREQTGRLDSLTTEAIKAIDLLQERRAALISAAVTGKIDVRGLVQTEAA